MSQFTQQEQHLSDLYSSYSDEELLRLHVAGTLTEAAYGVLEAELRTRCIAIPNRPTELPVRESAPPLPFIVRLLLFIVGWVTILMIWMALAKSEEAGPIGISPSEVGMYALWDALKFVGLVGVPTLYLMKALLFPKKKKKSSVAK